MISPTTKIAPNTLSSGSFMFGGNDLSELPRGVMLRDLKLNTFNIQPAVRTRTTPEIKEALAPFSKTNSNSSLGIDAGVIQTWEGRVLDVDREAAVMRVLLQAKIGHLPDHVADIELQWVADQDLDLVAPGAIFYLTLYKQTSRGTIRNSQELRFRRLPAWGRKQVQRLLSDAENLRRKLRPLPVAE